MSVFNLKTVISPASLLRYHCYRNCLGTGRYSLRPYIPSARTLSTQLGLVAPDPSSANWNVDSPLKSGYFNAKEGPISSVLHIFFWHCCIFSADHHSLFLLRPHWLIDFQILSTTQSLDGLAPHSISVSTLFQTVTNALFLVLSTFVFFAYVFQLR